MIRLKLGISTTVSTGEIYSQEFLTLKEKLLLTQHTALDFAQTHKLKYVELSFLDPHSIKDINEREFLDMLSGYSFRYTYHAPIFEINIGATSESWRKMSVKTLKEHIEFSKKIGIENIVIHPYRPMGLDMFFIELIIENIIKSVAELQKENSLNILAENLSNPGELFSNPETLLLLEDCGYCFDTAHANCSGFTQSGFIKKLGKKIREVHVIDGIRNQPDMHLGIGRGDIDFRETKKALSNVGFSGPVILEAFSIEDATQSISKLKEIFG